MCVSIDGLGHRLGPPFLFQHFAFDLQYFTFLHIINNRIYIYMFMYSSLAAPSLFGFFTWICLRCLENVTNILPKWWFNGDFPWYNP